MDEQPEPLPEVAAPAPPKNKGGRPKGSKNRFPSEAVTRSNRTRAWKHGRYAKKVTMAEAKVAQLRKIHPDAPEILQAVVEALQGEGFEQLTMVGAQALTEAELIRRNSVAKINEDGVTVQDQTLSADGRVVGTKTRAHPLLEHLHRLHDTLGFTADAMRASAKSRGEGARDAAMAQLLRRRAMLQGQGKDGMLPPAPTVDTTAD
jgi:hypothetical protein